MSGLNFVAIDFETANSYRGSPCSVGLVRFRDGQPVGHAHLLIQPPAAAAHFDAFNTQLHGISAETVRDQPSWAERLNDIVEFIGDDIVVSHNASFDIGVIRYACAADGIAWPRIDFFCTLVAARRHLRLPSYRLPFVLDAYGAELNDHHHALADAEAAGRVATLMAADAGATSIPGLAESVGTVIGHMSADQFTGSVSIATARGGSAALSLPDANPDADPSGYLYGRTVVFTGALMSMTRQMAWDAVAHAGGQPAPTTTKKTNVLVIGDFNPASLRPGANVSGKAAKAFALQDKGQDIELMTEADFLQVLDGRSTMDEQLQQLLEQREAKPAEAGSQAASAPTFRPLRLPAKPTTQHCNQTGCEAVAAFRTRTRPTWCVKHIDAKLTDAGLRPLEEFTHPDSYRLTECLTCGCQAHYRLEYVLTKAAEGEPTCRACYWANWPRETTWLQDEALQHAGLTPAEVELFYAEHGDPRIQRPHDAERFALDAVAMHRDALGDAPINSDHFVQRVRCQHCGKIDVLRTNDLYHCTCCKC
ncbi:exonuclease domain-containing protein [Dermacoccus nishinomiyaensis]|uniref:exonuclease domain-containing protein n=1 Tax=Dermacoccus nishinomiyaensis TaxID=1274 RepID=UPI000939AC4E|nr:exonuclease domain-containing protein [Dermacoccus nishinomiyaensis]